jgi:hypothetical protein
MEILFMGVVNPQQKFYKIERKDRKGFLLPAKPATEHLRPTPAFLPHQSLTVSQKPQKHPGPRHKINKLRSNNRCVVGTSADD